MATSHHRHDDVRGLDIIKATLKPTKMDHFKALVAHNFKVTLRSPAVYIFGAMIPLLMIGTAIGIVCYYREKQIPYSPFVLNVI